MIRLETLEQAECCEWLGKSVSEKFKMIRKISLENDLQKGNRISNLADLSAFIFALQRLDVYGKMFDKPCLSGEQVEPLRTLALQNRRTAPENLSLEVLFVFGKII